MKRFLTFLPICFLVITSTMLFPIYSNAVDDVKLGIIIPLTGSAARIGEAIKLGYDFGVEEINSRGGIKSLGGAKLKIIYADTQSKPTVAVSETERLIEREKVAIVLGEYASFITLAATPVAERLQKPFIAPVPAADRITQRGFKYLFRINAPATVWTRDTLKVLATIGDLTGKKIKTVGLFYEDTEYGQNVAKVNKELAKEFGLEVVADISFPKNTADLTAKVSKLKAANPDAVLPVVFIEDGILFAETRYRMGFNPIVVHSGTGALEPEYYTLDVTNLEFTVSHWNWDISKEATALNSSFHKKYGKDMTGNIAICYQSILLAAEALETAKSIDGEAIRTALSTLEIKPGPKMIMPYKRIKFDSNGQNDSQLVTLQMVNKKCYTIAPPNFSSKKIVLPK